MNSINDLLRSWNPTWTDLGIILQLVILEGLLSFDNALALAALVKTRLKDPKDQKHALLWGIWGAYAFRTGIIFVGVWLMNQPLARVIAGAYLVYLAINELIIRPLFHKEDAVSELKPSKFKFAFLSPLWATIVAVELMDIMFSIDSIGVALALSQKAWVLIAGAVIGIVMMRVAAQVFIKLIDKFPVLSKTAFLLVGIAGLNILLQFVTLSPHFSIVTSIAELNRINGVISENINGVIRNTHTGISTSLAIGEHPLLIILISTLIISMILNRIFPKVFGEPKEAEKK